MFKTYETHVEGIRILPGQWRPHYAFEQIAWVSPPWPSQDYVWLDFPEAIFTNAGLLYLSHVNPTYPVLFPDLPRVQWESLEDGIRFHRVLPNGVSFGGSVHADGPNRVLLRLYIDNGSRQQLRDIRLQTCAYLRGIKEFSDFTEANKYVHVPRSGWIPFEKALSSGVKGKYHLGFHGEGPLIADLPIMVTCSNAGQRLVAMTWHDSSMSIVSNPSHPCMHVDPFFPDLDAGMRKEIQGELIFFEGSIAEFDDWLGERLRRG